MAGYGTFSDWLVPLRIASVTRRGQGATCAAGMFINVHVIDMSYHVLDMSISCHSFWSSCFWHNFCLVVTPVFETDFFEIDSKVLMVSQQLDSDKE